MHSSDVIRYYCNNEIINDSKFQQINDWWCQLDGKTVNKQRITGIEQDISTNAWKVIQSDSPEQVVLYEPSLQRNEFTVLVKYTSSKGLQHQIESVAIDLDFKQQNLFIWTTNAIEILIFSRF